MGNKILIHKYKRKTMTEHLHFMKWQLYKDLELDDEKKLRSLLNVLNVL